MSIQNTEFILVLLVITINLLLPHSVLISHASIHNIHVKYQILRVIKTNLKCIMVSPLKQWSAFNECAHLKNAVCSISRHSKVRRNVSCCLISLMQDMRTANMFSRIISCFASVFELSLHLRIHQNSICRLSTKSILFFNS